MLSNNSPLPNRKHPDSLCDVSDVTDLRDAGENVQATLAPPAGCRSDEAEPKTSDQTLAETTDADPAGCRPADEPPKQVESADKGFLSVTAQGGPSGELPNEPQTAAESVKSRRDFEAFLRASGFSRAVSKAVATSGWPADGETKTDDEDRQAELANELIQLFRL